MNPLERIDTGRPLRGSQVYYNGGTSMAFSLVKKPMERVEGKVAEGMA